MSKYLFQKGSTKTPWENIGHHKNSVPANELN